jgi:hypothetical protein
MDSKNIAQVQYIATFSPINLQKYIGVGEEKIQTTSSIAIFVFLKLQKCSGTFLHMILLQQTEN